MCVCQKLGTVQFIEAYLRTLNDWPVLRVLTKMFVYGRWARKLCELLRGLFGVFFVAKDGRSYSKRILYSLTCDVVIKQ